ncbi:HAMP domain-containing sensor histidine kinase [Novosphingobium sp. Gsoil 351]|uniref:sensor histidine kinase n=1 Tax=Novosphingobium sp. Gsoil 351 TaxID=2675225 RepID=UPI001E2CA4B9|nr:ATP-binding protein [Novosphingobium sp. Gsoil 351]
MRVSWQGLARSTTVRLVVLVFACQVATTAAVLWYVGSASETALTRQEQATVGELKDELVSAYAAGGQPRLIEEMNERLSFTFGHTAVLLLVAPDGTRLAGNLARWPRGTANDTPWRVLTLYRTSSVTAERIGLTAVTLPDGSRLLAGHVVEGTLILNDVGRSALIGAMLLAVPLALLIAVFVGRLIDRRISTLATTVDAVSAGDLSRRVPADGSADAFDRLALGVNAMLARIEMLVGELRTVTDALAHDLRSPVTRMKSVIEAALRDADDPANRLALGQVAEEADIVLAMLTTALTISRAEAGIGRDLFAPTDVTALLRDAAEIYGPVAEDSGFALSVGAVPEGAFMLHRQLVSQAIGNLVENAMKYADGGSAIVLSAESAPTELRLIVTDDGIGIPAERRDEARARFHRLDPARHLPGSGLGLALVEAVARLHGGSLELADNHPGLSATIRLTRLVS